MQRRDDRSRRRKNVCLFRRLIRRCVHVLIMLLAISRAVKSLCNNKNSAHALMYKQSFSHREKKQNVWRLPDFQRFTSFEVQGALANIAVMKNNMEVLMKRSNRTRALNGRTREGKMPWNWGTPTSSSALWTGSPPPVLNVTWLKNKEVVSKGVEETDFYPSVDNTFRKFSYLPFVPEQGDIYVCQVEHWGIPEGKMEKIWVSKAPSPIPETMENVLCALGLAFGILGIIAGTILFFKAMRMNDRRGFM
uniref:Ig-like domain-containing protein n=1 Tax=Podarcis muralis TaxID=64176 RepID=A0A670HNU5_PODMU